MTNTKTILSLLALSFLAAAGCANVDAGIDADESDLSRRANFDVFEGKDGRTYFNFQAPNHEIILASQGYATRTGALAGVLSVLDNATDEAAFDVKESRDGGAYFNLLAGNGAVIATSEVYASKSNAKRGVQTVLNNVGDYLAFSARRTGARFVVFEGENERYYYQLRAKNGQIVMRSQGYASEAGALNATFSVVDNGVDASNFEVLASADGGFYFNLVAGNGQIIGTSEVYSTKSNCKRAVEAVATLAGQVDVL